MSSIPRALDPRACDPASADARAALAVELLAAPTMRALALTLVGHAQHAHGARDVLLAWSPDGGSAREQHPQRPISPDEERLLADALAQRYESPVRSADHRWAFPMRGDGPGSWAVLIAEADRLGEGWEAFLELARPRVAQALEVERLRHSVRRLEKAERLQRALFGIADLASSVLDMNEVLRAMHDIVATLMYAENLYIVQFDPARDAVRFLYFVDSVDTDAPSPEHEYPMKEIEYSPTWHLIRRGKPLMGTTEDLLQQLDAGAPLHGSGPRALDWLGVPLLSGREVRGAIVVQSYVGICYTAEDNALLQFVARHIQTAIERKQAQEELERRVEERTR